MDSKRLVFQVIAGDFSFGCESLGSSHIEHKVYIEDPFKFGSLDYEPSITDVENITYYCELGHYIKFLIDGSPAHCLAIASPDDLFVKRNHEFYDMMEGLIPYVASKEVVINLMEYADMMFENDEVCRACTVLKFCSQMLDTETFPVRETVSSPSETVYKDYREEVEHKLSKDNIREWADKIEIDRVLVDLRKAARPYIPGT